MGETVFLFFLYQFLRPLRDLLSGLWLVVTHFIPASFIYKCCFHWFMIVLMNTVWA